MIKSILFCIVGFAGVSLYANTKVEIAAGDYKVNIFNNSNIRLEVDSGSVLTNCSKTVNSFIADDSSYNNYETAELNISKANNQLVLNLPNQIQMSSSRVNALFGKDNGCYATIHLITSITTINNEVRESSLEFRLDAIGQSVKISPTDLSVQINNSDKSKNCRPFATLVSNNPALEVTLNTRESAQEGWLGGVNYCEN